MSSATARMITVWFAEVAPLFNISRLLGGMLPRQRAALIDPASRPFAPIKRMLKFPRSPRGFNSRGGTEAQTDATS